MLALLLAFCAPRAVAQEDEYIIVYALITKADMLNSSGQIPESHTNYIKAQKALLRFQRSFSSWQPKLVAYRLDYLAGKIKATADSAMADPEGEVKLLDAGRTPRKVLRLHPAAGGRQSLRMTSKISTTSATTPSMNLPTMIMAMDTEVKELSPDGEITYQFVFGETTVAADADTTEGTTEALSTAMGGLRGLSGTGKVSSSGVSGDVEVTLPAGSNQMLKQTVGQMKDTLKNQFIPLPAEAVGTGAKWEIKSKIKARQGINLDQTETVELVSLDGDMVLLRVAISQNAPNQQVESPMVPGIKLDLTKMIGTGTGNSTIDLGRVFPVSGNADATIDTSMALNMGGQKQTFDTTMKIKVTVEGK